MWPELDGLRAEALRYRRQVVAAIQARTDLLVKLKSEDEKHVDGLMASARDGAEPPEDARTPQEERDRQVAASEERLWAQVAVAGQHADSIIEHLRASEDEYLADLRSRLEPAQEKRREAERLLAEAKADEVRLYLLGRWLQVTTDDGSFGRQPAPAPAQPVPARLSAEVFKDALERPWHKVRPEWSTTKTRAAA